MIGEGFVAAAAAAAAAAVIVDHISSKCTVGANEISCKMRTWNENTEMRSVTLKWEMLHWNENSD